jgi:lysosomal Pro-X carboxypeptidase
MSGWNILACADQAMPMNTNGVKDMFWPADFDYDAYTSFCYDEFGIKPDYDYTLNHFGGVTDREYLAASRIIFTNGGLDPWSGASPTTNLSDTLVACFIRKGFVI